MSSLKILVVEDEMIIANNICDILEDLSYTVIEPAISYSEAISFLDLYQPDFAILDIQLSGEKTGVDVARYINEKQSIPFIFLTSNSDESTLNQAKLQSPSAYLLKPFKKENLYTSIELAISNFQMYPKTEISNKPDTDFIFIKEKQTYIKLKLKDILFIKSDHIYIEIQTDQKMYLLRSSLNEVISKLSTHFLRVHKSYIVNLEHLNSFDNETINISNTTIPLGRKYKSVFFSQIKFI